MPKACRPFRGYDCRRICRVRINANLPTEEEILEEFLVAEGVLQEMQVHMEEDSSEEEEEIISTKVGRQALETVKNF